MRRIVAIISILMLMLSHASMGEAAPHHAVNDAHATAPAGHEARTLPAWHGQDGEDDRDARGVCHVAHVHNIVDLARADTAIARPVAPAAPPFAACGAVALGSRAVAPLLEPPAV